MAVHDIVCVRLRQALGEDIEGFAAVARARHNQLALARDAFLILDFRDKPRGVGLPRMHDDREAKCRRLDAGDLRKRPALVRGDENAVVVLHPHALRRRRTLRKTMDILGDGVVGLLGGSVFGPHAFAAQAPAGAAVLGEPDTPGGDRDPHAPRIARVDADRMDTGQVRAAPHPLLALGMVPERADHVPALPAIARAEEPARQRSAPDDAGLVAAAGLERPDARRAPTDRPAPHVVLLVALRFGRIGRRSDLLPSIRCRAVKLDAEMTVVECRITPPVATVAEREGDIVSQKFDPRDLPLLRLARDRQQTFAGRNENRIAHSSASRQSLKDVDGTRLGDRVGQARAIADHPAIDEDGHMFAQSRLVIEHVAARLRIVRKNRFKNVAYGTAGGFGRRQRDVPLDVGREDDLGHGSRSLIARLLIALPWAGTRACPGGMELSRPPCPRLLRASASFLGLGGYRLTDPGYARRHFRRANRLRDVASRRLRAILPTRRCTSKRVDNGASAFEVPAEACSRLLPILLRRTIRRNAGSA